MLFLPAPSHQARFDYLSLPLPKRLLPWLMEKRGLSVYVLPAGESWSDRFYCRQMRTAPYAQLGDGRVMSQTPHYNISKKAAVIPFSWFYSHLGSYALIHEVGHALDYLFLGTGTRLSDSPEVGEVLTSRGPLSKYTQEKDGRYGNHAEQFAEGFEAYFREPNVGRHNLSISNLTWEMVDFFRHLITEHFGN